MQTLYDLSMPLPDGREQPLSAYRGRVLLIVNTASRCGFTGQYAGLEALQRRFGPQGLTVLGFPCNQFGGQEPGTAEEIGEFCRTRFDVTFPLSAKVEVKGQGAHPVFRHLTRAKPGIFGTQAIKWNFTKFLIDRQGEVVARFGPRTPPERLEANIARLLAAPAPPSDAVTRDSAV